MNADQDRCRDAKESKVGAIVRDTLVHCPPYKIVTIERSVISPQRVSADRRRKRRLEGDAFVDTATHIISNQ